MNIDYRKISESVCNLKSLFIKKGRVILIICPVFYIVKLGSKGLLTLISLQSGQLLFVLVSLTIYLFSAGGKDDRTYE